jgi:hypothetical protein
MFANLQSSTPTFVDNICDVDKRANGTAVLRIRYSDGETGVLTVGCHGPGAPPDIFEGIAMTRGYRTCYDVQAPVTGVDANRTIFHVGDDRANCWAPRRRGCCTGAQRAERSGGDRPPVRSRHVNRACPGPPGRRRPD